jgi:hypothetical protein
VAGATPLIVAGGGAGGGGGGQSTLVGAGQGIGGNGGYRSGVNPNGANGQSVGSGTGGAGGLFADASATSRTGLNGTNGSGFGGSGGGAGGGGGGCANNGVSGGGARGMGGTTTPNTLGNGGAGGGGAAGQSSLWTGTGCTLATPSAFNAVTNPGTTAAAGQVVLNWIAAGPTPISCSPPTVYLSQGQPGAAPTTTQLFTTIATPGSFTLSPLGPTSGNLVYNAVGYNPDNRFLYALLLGSLNSPLNRGSDLQQIDANGTVTSVGRVTGLPYGWTGTTGAGTLLAPPTTTVPANQG